MSDRKWLVSAGMIIGLGCAQGAVAAGSGADALLNAVQPQHSERVAEKQVAQPVNPILGGEVKLSDPFLMQFFASWQSERGLPYEVNAWSLRLVRQQLREASHLWRVIQPSMPESFRTAANAGQIYLYWKLNLPQTFLNAWLEELRKESFRNSTISVALEQTLAPGFAKWLLDSAVVLSPEQEHWISSMPASKSVLQPTLKALALLRKGEAGTEVLASLPADNELKIPLGETVALALARKGDLSAAGRVLKRDVEPAIEAKKDAALLARHDLQVARLLYQAGALEGAEEFYGKIPSGTAEFLKAREELVWVWLRKGDFGKLRGSLVTLGSSLFDDHFSPEVFMVRAVSNLKLCYYDEVRSDFEHFMAKNKQWATRISAAVKAENPPVPQERDFFTRWADQALSLRQEEKTRLEALAQESIAAALPAVGPQQHWTRAKDQLLATLDSLKKRQADEYRRQWRNEETELSEAIRKMKFVKVELLSQVRMAQRNIVDVVKTSSAAAVQAPLEHQKAQSPIQSETEIAFPFDGVIWPDELFRLRSVAPGRCLGQGDRS